MSAKIEPASALASAGLHWDIVNSKIWTSDFQSTLASVRAPRSTASPVAIRTVATFLPFRSTTVLIWPAFSAVAISEASSPMIPPTMRRSVPLAMCAAGRWCRKPPDPISQPAGPLQAVRGIRELDEFDVEAFLVGDFLGHEELGVARDGQVAHLQGVGGVIRSRRWRTRSIPVRRRSRI